MVKYHIRKKPRATLPHFGDLFAGIGGFHCALGRPSDQWGAISKTTVLCEIEPRAQRVLRKRIPGTPIYADVRSLASEALDDMECATLGFPCQGLSAVGKRKGLKDPRTGLWRHIPRLLKNCQKPPRFLFIENSPRLRKYLPKILADLVEANYDSARWGIFSGSLVGARHLRRRMLILARHAWSDQAYPMSSDIRTNLNEIARGFQGPGTQLGCSVKYVGRQCAEKVRRCEMLGNAVIVPLMAPKRKRRPCVLSRHAVHYAQSALEPSSWLDISRSAFDGIRTPSRSSRCST